MPSPIALGERVAMTNAPPPPAWPDRQPVAIAEIGPPGGFWIRFVAYIIDSFIVSIASVVIVVIFITVVLLVDESTDDSKDSLFIAGSIIVMGLALMAINWPYEELMTCSPTGATLSKRTLGLPFYPPTHA